MAQRIINPAVPNLPLGPEQYERRYQDQHSNVLRLYFNQLRNSLGLLLGRLGGQYLENPYIAASNTVDHTLATINTPTLVTFDSADFEVGGYVAPNDGFHVTQGGIYNYAFSIQFENADTQIHDAYVWLRINGVDAPWTGSFASITSRHGGVNGYNIVAANFFVRLNADDYVEMWWAANSTQISMRAIPATTSPYARPGSPSVVATLSFVSALPS